MKALLFFVVGMAVISCGRNVDFPRITQPADGQKMVMDQTACFDVLLDLNTYEGTEIEIRGHEALNGDLTCRNGVNAPASCCRTYSSGSVGVNNYNQNCVEGRPCQLTIIARKGEKSDVRTITVVRYTQSTN